MAFILSVIGGPVVDMKTILFFDMISFTKCILAFDACWSFVSYVKTCRRLEETVIFRHVLVLCVSCSEPCRRLEDTLIFRHVLLVLYDSA